MPKNLWFMIYSWEAMLSMTKVDLDLISDVAMYLFLKKKREVVFLIFLKETARGATNI